MFPKMYPLANKQTDLGYLESLCKMAWKNYLFFPAVQMHVRRNHMGNFFKAPKHISLVLKDLFNSYNYLHSSA